MCSVNFPSIRFLRLFTGYNIIHIILQISTLSTLHITVLSPLPYLPLLPSITGACALYLHCVALLKDMLQRVFPLMTNKVGRQNPPSSSPDSFQQAANQNQACLERLQQVRVWTVIQLLFLLCCSRFSYYCVFGNSFRCSLSWSAIIIELQ